MGMLRNMSKSILTIPDSDHLDLLDSVARELRRGFEQLKEDAEKELSGKHFVFSSYGKELYPYFEQTDANLVPGCIIPTKQGRPVASVDSTCVLLGETSDGALYAARSGLGFSVGGLLKRYVRLGPVLVYASEKGLSGIGSSLRGSELGMVLSDHAVAERVIRNLIENQVVLALMGAEEEMIVVADGSLKHPMGQFRGPGLPRGRSTLVGFSKTSSLLHSFETFGSLNAFPKPAYLMVGGGEVTTVLAKFAPDGMAFRLDVAARRDPLEKVLGHLLWNDAFHAGYPESLRAAHHLSVFTRAENQALKAYVTKSFRLRRLPTFPLRQVALGTFKGGA
jgi:hypothetical protein